MTGIANRSPHICNLLRIDHDTVSSGSALQNGMWTFLKDIVMFVMMGHIFKGCHQICG
jgi:hypothetical protein